MRRATITLSDELEAELKSYLDAQDAAPSLTAVVEAALSRYFEEKRLEMRQYRPPQGPLRITPAAEEGGDPDASLQHDRVLAEDL